ncbi:MAG: DUF2065 family protein [Porticoccaceae bacterium]|nr:DUF2065 family protein [Porticoccaceae bacterium]
MPDRCRKMIMQIAAMDNRILRVIGLLSMLVGLCLLLWR